MSFGRSEEALVWIDCEMTGLNLVTDEIMSICCFITDAELNLKESEGYEVFIHHDKERLDKMDEWCTKTHAKTGLTQKCIDSTTTAETASEELYGYIKKYVPERRKALLAGNSVHYDKDFLNKEPFTKVINHLHHRILDVSSIKEAARRWSPIEVVKAAPKKKALHEARQDIIESIAEARYYKEVFFTKPTPIEKTEEPKKGKEPKKTAEAAKQDETKPSSKEFMGLFDTGS